MIGDLSVGNFIKVEQPKPTSNRRLIIAVAGEEGTGKTSFALSAPGPTMYLNLDTGDEGVVDKYLDKEVYRVKYRISPFAGADECKKIWERYKQDFAIALKSDAKTVIVDTATEAWELHRLARFGKLAQVLPEHYGPVNREHASLLKDAFDSNKNLILLHKMTPEYVNKVNTGRLKLKGFSDTPYIVQVNITTEKEQGEFYLYVKKCRVNQTVEELHIPVADPLQGFDTLASFVWG